MQGRTAGAPCKGGPQARVQRRAKGAPKKGATGAHRISGASNAPNNSPQPDAWPPDTFQPPLRRITSSTPPSMPSAIATSRNRMPMLIARLGDTA